MKTLRDVTVEKMAEVIDDLAKLRNLFSSDEFTELLQTFNDKQLSESDVTFLYTLSTFRDALFKEVKSDAFSF
jgi:hypothetical protein